MYPVATMPVQMIQVPGYCQETEWSCCLHFCKLPKLPK